MVSGGNEVGRIMRQRYRNPDSSCQSSLLLLYKHPDATLEQFFENKHPNDYAAHECWGFASACRQFHIQEDCRAGSYQRNASVLGG